MVMSKMSVGKPGNIGFEEEKPPVYNWHNPGHESSELLDEIKVMVLANFNNIFILAAHFLLFPVLTIC